MDATLDGILEQNAQLRYTNAALQTNANRLTEAVVALIGYPVGQQQTIELDALLQAIAAYGQRVTGAPDDEPVQLAKKAAGK